MINEQYCKQRKEIDAGSTIIRPLEDFFNRINPHATSSILDRIPFNSLSSSYNHHLLDQLYWQSQAQPHSGYNISRQKKRRTLTETGVAAAAR